MLGGVGGRSLTEALTSSSLRVEIWQMSLPLIRQYPWLGTGFGGFQANYVPYAIPDEAVLAHAHNLWLSLAAEAGIPVMILLTSIVGWICYRAVQTYRLGRLPLEAQPLLVGYGLGFLACTLFALFDIAFFDARVNVLGWLMLAGLQAIADLADAPGSRSPLTPRP
jgi:O-antigen ligase